MSNLKQRAIKALEIMEANEPEFLQAVTESLEHLAKTYGDKYNSPFKPIDTKEMLYHPIMGASINPYQMSRYLQRFMSQGYDKSGNKNDVQKIIHYALFEMVRMNRTGGVKNVDIVDGEHRMSEKEFNAIDIATIKPIRPSFKKKVMIVPKKKKRK